MTLKFANEKTEDEKKLKERVLELFDNWKKRKQEKGFRLISYGDVFELRKEVEEILS